MPVITEAPLDLVPDISASSALKDEGGALFKAGDVAAADEKYDAAIEGLSAKTMTWPAADALALLCHSNRAMCQLKLQRPELALHHCEAGLALPSAVRNPAVLAKLLARKAQACIESDPPRHEDAAAALAEARSRGLWTKPMASKFSALAQGLDKPLVAPKPLPDGCPGRMPLKLAVTEMLNQLSLNHMSSDDLVRFYGGLLQDGIMEPAHVCAVDPEEGGTLMWALCFALSDLGGDARTFCRLLKLFVTEFGAPIDQRMEQGRTPLIFAASSHCIAGGVVEAALALGADPRIRDELGWTGKKTRLFAPFYTKNDHFAKTGSGQT